MKRLSVLAVLCLNVGCGVGSPGAPAESTRVILPMASIGEINDFNMMIDRDKNQKISLAEFKAGVSSSAHPLAIYAKDPEALEMGSQKYIALLDQNQDGELSFEEGSGEALYTVYFEAQDLNKNGMLDKDEFKIYNQKLSDVENLKDKVIVNLMSHDRTFFLSMADDNSDALISKDEFLKFGMTPLGGESAQPQCTIDTCTQEGSPYAEVETSAM
jgi:hypothetical protein